MRFLILCPGGFTTVIKAQQDGEDDKNEALESEWPSSDPRSAVYYFMTLRGSLYQVTYLDKEPYRAILRVK